MQMVLVDTCCANFIIVLASFLCTFSPCTYFNSFIVDSIVSGSHPSNGISLMSRVALGGHIFLVYSVHKVKRTPPCDYFRQFPASKDTRTPSSCTYDIVCQSCCPRTYCFQSGPRSAAHMAVTSSTSSSVTSVQF